MNTRNTIREILFPINMFYWDFKNAGYSLNIFRFVLWLYVLNETTYQFKTTNCGG